jgi:hypothetical protein
VGEATSLSSGPFPAYRSTAALFKLVQLLMEMIFFPLPKSNIVATRYTIHHARDADPLANNAAKRKCNEAVA